MPPARPLRVLRPAPRALHGRAADDLRFIRETMESSSSFTAVPGKGGVAMGAIGCLAAVVASAQTSREAWLVTWLAAATAAVAVGVVALAKKARAGGQPLARGVGARFVRSLCPTLGAGALLSVVLWRAGAAESLPGMWLLLYGAGLMAAGAFSIAIVPTLGASFMALGAAAFATPAAWGDLWMALGFGGLHAVFGAVIWRRNGG